MTTIMLTVAVLGIAVTAGIPVGIGLTERSFVRSWKLLAQQRRRLTEQERAVRAALVQHYRCRTCKRLGYPECEQWFRDQG